VPHQIWLGGSSNQTRLAEVFKERVKLNQLEATLEPLFFYWKSARCGACYTKLVI